MNSIPSSTKRWVVMPGDYGIVKGTNTTRLCGGAMPPDGSISLGYFILIAPINRKFKVKGETHVR